MPRSHYANIWSTGRRQQLLLIGLSLVIVPLSMAPLELQRRIVNEAIKQALELGALRPLAVLCAAYVAVILVQGGLKWTVNICKGRISEDFSRRLRRHAYQAFTREPRRANDELRGGGDVAVITAEVEPVGAFAGISLGTPVLNVGTLVGIAGYMLYAEPILALVALGLIVPQAVLVAPVQNAINRRAAERVKHLRDVGELMVPSDVVNSRTEAQAAKRLDSLLGRMYALRMGINYLKFSLKLALNLTRHLGEIGVLFFGGWMVIEGRTEVGVVVAFLTGLRELKSPWREVLAFFRQLSDVRVKYALIRHHLAEPSTAS